MNASSSTAPGRYAGVFAPVVTPFDRRLAPDAERLANHCRWLLSQGCGLAVFGTNSEANSMSVGEKVGLLQNLVDAGIDPHRMLPGTGACSVTDAIELSSHAVRLGCGGVLMLPPFYYKGVSDDGLFRYYSEVIEGVGDRDLRIYLYHIPPVAQVGLSETLIERLVEAWPGTVCGIKDSSGDWSHTSALLDRAWDDFRIFVGSETFLLANMRRGGAGCISATANVNPSAIRHLYDTWQASDAEEQQQALDKLRNLLQRYPMIPALKSVVARFGNDAAWHDVRPPLVPLSDRQRIQLFEDLDASGFDMPGPGV